MNTLFKPSRVSCWLFLM